MALPDPSPGQAAGDAPLRLARLVVLDDEESIGRLIERVAETMGFLPVVTTSGAEFRAACAARMPDVVILDLQLGEGDSTAELHHLAATGYANPLILMSGFDSTVLASAGDLATGLGLRLAATITKPMRVANLRALLTPLRG